MAGKQYIIVQDGQTLWDLAVQYLGAPEGIQSLMEDNPGKLNLESLPIAGTEILIDDTKIINKDVVRLFKERAISPNTGSDLGHLAFSSGFNIGFN